MKKRLNGRGKKLGEEKSRKKVGAPGILLLTDQFRNHLKSLPVIGHKKYFCAQSQARILNGFGTGRLREGSQGLLLSFLTFLRPIFFLARLAFFPPPLTAPGSPRMEKTLPANELYQLHTSGKYIYDLIHCAQTNVNYFPLKIIHK